VADPVIITVPPQQRQIAKTLPFDPTLALYINWESIAEQAKQLGADFEVRREDNGAVTVTLFWRYLDEAGVTRG
jgi:hypothetical protein